MLVPVVVYWWRSGRIMGSQRGLTIGAVAGAGVGLLEAQWTLNFILGSGWVWGDVQTYGVVKLAGFWETFFILGFNVASCALAGWGLGKGWGWQFYLLASFAYAILLYTPALAEVHLVEGIQLEFVIAAWALLLTGVVLWLRKMRKE